jgi:hypothetical protein
MCEMRHSGDEEDDAEPKAKKDAKRDDGDEEDADADEAAMKERAKADSPIPAAAREGQLFVDEVGDRALAEGSAALEPDLQALLTDVQAASDYEDLRLRLLARHGAMNRKDLAKLVERAILLAELGGRFAVRKEAADGRASKAALRALPSAPVPKPPEPKPPAPDVATQVAAGIVAAAKEIAEALKAAHPPPAPTRKSIVLMRNGQGVVVGAEMKE